MHFIRGINLNCILLYRFNARKRNWVVEFTRIRGCHIEFTWLKNDIIWATRWLNQLIFEVRTCNIWEVFVTFSFLRWFKDIPLHYSSLKLIDIWNQASSYRLVVLAINFLYRCKIFFFVKFSGILSAIYSYTVYDATIAAWVKKGPFLR